MNSEPPPDSTHYLRQLFDDLEFSHLVLVAAQLGIADLVASDPRSAAELAAMTGTDPSSLYRLLRALSSRGLFQEHADKTFSLTPLADPLRQDAPHSMRPQALWSGSEAYLRTWAGLSYSVRTGKPAFEHVYGKPIFPYFAEQPALGRIFDDVMSSASGDEGAAIAQAYDFSGYRKIVDVGGGHGALLATILDQYPEAYGVLFDLPDVTGSAQGPLDRHLSTLRAEKVSGDFFQAVPRGADVYLLKWVVHDWDDEAAVSILKSCRSAMATEGKVLLVEAVIPPKGASAANATRLDVTMLVFTGSRERTEDEYADLLRRAGLTLVHTTPTASPFSILEADPI